MNDDEERGEKKTIEEWATAKGYLPEKLPVPGRVGKLSVVTERPNPQFVHYAMAKAHRGWPVGAEVTEEEFDKAVEEAGNVPLA